MFFSFDLNLSIGRMFSFIRQSNMYFFPYRMQTLIIQNISSSPGSPNVTAKSYYLVLGACATEQRLANHAVVLRKGASHDLHIHYAIPTTHAPYSYRLLCCFQDHLSAERATMHTYILMLSLCGYSTVFGK